MKTTDTTSYIDSLSTIAFASSVFSLLYFAVINLLV